ncbi:hypothetical protein LINGRAPRIM_LOCUS1791 [Linum grandiflorum]
MESTGKNLRFVWILILVAGLMVVQGPFTVLGGLPSDFKNCFNTCYNACKQTSPSISWCNQQCILKCSPPSVDPRGVLHRKLNN